MSLLRRSLMLNNEKTIYKSIFTLRFEKNNNSNKVSDIAYGIAFAMTISFSGYNNAGSQTYSTGLIDDVNIKINVKRKTDGVNIYSYETTKNKTESSYFQFRIVDNISYIDVVPDDVKMPLENGLYIVELIVSSTGKITTGTNNEAMFTPDEYVYLYNYRVTIDKNTIECKCLDSIQETIPDPAVSPKGIKNEMTYFGG